MLATAALAFIEEIMLTQERRFKHTKYKIAYQDKVEKVIRVNVPARSTPIIVKGGKTVIVKEGSDMWIVTENEMGLEKTKMISGKWYMFKGNRVVEMKDEEIKQLKTYDSVTEDTKSVSSQTMNPNFLTFWCGESMCFFTMPSIANTKSVEARLPQPTLATKRSSAKIQKSFKIPPGKPMPCGYAVSWSQPMIHM